MKPIVDLFSTAWQTKDLSIPLRAAHETSCAFGFLVTTIDADSDYFDALLRTGYLWSAWLNVLLAAFTWARAFWRRAGAREIVILGASLGVHTLVALAPGFVASARWFFMGFILTTVPPRRALTIAGAFICLEGIESFDLILASAAGAH